MRVIQGAHYRARIHSVFTLSNYKSLDGLLLCRYEEPYEVDVDGMTVHLVHIYRHNDRAYMVTVREEDLFPIETTNEELAKMLLKEEL